MALGAQRGDVVWMVIRVKPPANVARLGNNVGIARTLK
jgi:hypothetical protein